MVCKSTVWISYLVLPPLFLPLSCETLSHERNRTSIRTSILSHAPSTWNVSCKPPQMIPPTTPPNPPPPPLPMPSPLEMSFLSVTFPGTSVKICLVFINSGSVHIRLFHFTRHVFKQGFLELRHSDSDPFPFTTKMQAFP